MYSEQYQYLLQHRKLSVPGIGTFLLKREPANLDFANKEIYPPVYTFILKPETASSPKDVILRFNDFYKDLNDTLNRQGEIHWNGLGKIYKNASGVVVLDPVRIQTGNPLAAHRVLREKAEHMVRVGEDERTSIQMEAMLIPGEEKKSYWWAWALAVALIALMFIGWYFSENGMDTTATSGRQKLTPGISTETYKLVGQ